MRGRQYASLWAAGLWAGVCVLVFTVLVMGILGLQQRILAQTNETRDVLVPKFLEQIRAVRNLEMLAHYGSLAVTAADPVTRQNAAFLAAYAAANPGSQTDERTRRLATKAYQQIQAFAARERDPAEWKALEEELSARADELAVATGNLVMQRATSIRDASLTVRNVAIALALLFAGSMGTMLVVGRSLTARMRAKSQLFNEASHDFRQRLHGMQLLINTAKHAPPAQGAAIMSRVQATTDDLHRYLENFLEIARLDAVVLKPVIQQVVLHDVFQRLELQFQEAALHRDVDIKFRHTRLSCVTDERMLLRILENLVANAVKFTRSKVLVAARQRDGRVEISVTDNGPGWPEPSMRNPCHPFVQVSDAPAGSTPQGFGLGLSIVTRLAALLDAPIRIATRTGHGATVYIGLGSAAPP
jgi:signal transduction histidine kinase